MVTALRVTRVRVNRAGVRRMMGAPFMVREMDRRMQKARLLAIAIAPVDTGAYVARLLRSGAVDSGVSERGVAHARLIQDVKSPEGAPYGYFVEVGTRHMRAQRILRRALRAVGD